MVRREGVVTCGFLVRVSVVSGDDDVCSRRLIHIPWLSYEKSHSIINESKWVEDKDGLKNEVVNWGIRETILKL